MLIESTNQQLVPQVMVDDLADLCIENMSQYDPYEDESQNVETYSSLEETEVITKLDEPILKCKDITPKRRQHGQRLTSMLES